MRVPVGELSTQRTSSLKISYTVKVIKKVSKTQ